MVEGNGSGNTVCLSRDSLNELKVILGEIEEIKKADEALYESEECYRLLFEDDLTGDFVASPDGRILICNPAYVKIFGFSSREEAIGSSIEELHLQPGGYADFIKLLREHKVLKGYECDRRRRDGAVIHIVENIVGDFDERGELLQFKGYVFDDTERKKAEEALRESEERFRALVTASSEVLYRMSPDWREMRQLHSRGFLANTEKPNTNWLHEYIPTEDQPQVTAIINEAIRTRSIFELEHRVIRIDGSMGWTNSRAVPLLNAKGEITEWFGAAKDITERKRAEEALRRSRDELELRVQERTAEIEEQRGRLQAIVDSLPVGLWVADATGKMVFINDVARHIWGGRAPCAKSVDEYGLYKAWWADTGERIAAEDMPMARALKGETIKEVAFDFERFDGTRGTQLVSASPVMDAKDNVLGCIAVVQDITERKKAEEALQQSNRNYSALFNNKTVGLAYCKTIFDEHNHATDYFVLDVNPTYESMTGIPRNQIIGKKITEAAPGVSQDLIDRHNRVAVTGEESRFEIYESVTDRWYDVDVFSPQKGYFISMFFNITERKQAEEALREAKDHLEIRVKERTSELELAVRNLHDEVAKRKRVGDELESSRRLLRHIIDNTPALVYVLDREERLQVANKALGDLLARNPEELIGKRRHEFMEKHVADRDEENDRQVIAAGTPMTFEEAGTFKGDRVTTFLTVKFPIRHENGEIYAVGGISTDITDRKQSEKALCGTKEELEVANEELRVELSEHEELEARLIKARDAAEAAANAKASFLANMSHELRTPLNAVIGFTSLLLDEPLTPDQKDYLESTRNGGEALLDLINDILDFSRAEKEKVVLEQQPISLTALVEESLGMVAVQAGKKGLDLAYTVGYGTPDTIIGDPDRLRQVLVNLLSNAVKFTDQGGVSVSVSSKPVQDTKRQILFEVLDTGIGIPEEKMNELFQPFGQTEYSISRKRGGVGLGLAISKRLVELMGGRIWADSMPGKGSKFRFTIQAEAVPGRRMDIEDMDKVAFESAPGQKSLKILVAEDNPSNQKVLVEMLKRMGYRPDAVADGREVLQSLERQKYDLILMDIRMPEMNGLEATKEIRRLWPAAKQPCIIAITAYAMNGDKEKCL
ncbi:MAG TPA: PAS domain S-box protein [Methanotrichaceae archaeon]|nr:PAS domain S-box protein [Methanotrichaceae archaeon]